MKWNEEHTSEGYWAYIGHPRFTGFIGTIDKRKYGVALIAHNKEQDKNRDLGTYKDLGKAVQRVERFFKESLHG